MKRCPECGREYDNTMSFCLDDGAELLYGPATAGWSNEEPATAILSEPGAVATGFRAGEAPTRLQIHATEQTAIFPGLEAEPHDHSGDLAEKQSLSANRAAEPQSKRNKFLAIIGVAVLFLVGGFFGYKYVSPTKQIESIAVMPFVNASGNPDFEYLSDGMTETLITSLSQLPNLNVKPRSVVFRYKGKDTSPDTVGTELKVQDVLSGRVVQRGSELSLFVELIDVASTKVVWSQQYNRKQSDIVSLQSEVARDVSDKLKSGLSSEDEKKVTRKYTDNPEAYRLYLLGNSLAARRKTADVRKAVETYEQAIAVDPNYALAYTGLAGARVFMTLYGGAPGAEELPKARAAAIKALEIDPMLAEAHAAMGMIAVFYERDFGEWERQQARSIELNPNNANFHRQIGLRHAWLGDFDDAIAEFRRSLELEPMAVVTHVNYGWTLYYSGQLAESDSELKLAAEIDPNVWFTQHQLFVNDRAEGNYADAIEHLARAQELRDEPEGATFIRAAYAKGGWPGFLKSVVSEPESSKIPEYYLAILAIELGDNEKAFVFLNKAFDKYDQFILFIKIDHSLDPLRGDPRFNELLKKLGFPQ